MFAIPNSNEIEKINILCIGDIMLDTFVEGSADRISPEAPIPVLRQKSIQTMLGGVGNVARNLRSLGANVSLISVVGQDDAAEKIQTLAKDISLDIETIVDCSRHTTSKTRFVANGQQLLRLDQEESIEISAKLEDQVITAVKRKIPSCDAVILSDYAKGLLTQNIITQTIQIAVNQGVKVFVDPKGSDFAKYKGATVLTPNLKEFQQACHHTFSDEQEMLEAADKVLKSTNTKAILLTRGKDGMSLIENGNKHTHIPTIAREVYDVSGAGDTVIATLSLFSCLGYELPKAASIANVAAGIVVGKVGTATVRWHELASTLATSMQSSNDKFVDLTTCLEKVAFWKRNGLTVGFTNGCFDLIHPGHISLLNQARSRCDRLIVGLNTDASVSRLKGPTRPVQKEVARAEVLAAMTDVDLVVLFDEDTPLNLIQAILPDLLVKGADYTVENVVGADVVVKNGGQLFLAELTPQQSSTKLINSNLSA